MQSKHLFVFIHIRNKGVVGNTWYRQTWLSPPIFFLLTVQDCGAFLLFVFHVCHAALSGHLLGKDLPLHSLVCNVF